MPHIVESGDVVGDCQLLDSRYIPRVLNCNSGVVGENMQERDGVVGHLLGPRIEDLDDTVCAFASPQWNGNYRANLAWLGGVLQFCSWVTLGFRHDRSEERRVGKECRCRW